MKVILIVALFAITASALNFTAYQLGFSHQLGLDYEQQQYLAQCQGSFANVLANVQSLAASNDLLQVVYGGVDIYNYVKTNLAADCQPFVIELITIAFQATNGTDLEKAIEKNFNTYGPQVVQNIAIWVEALGTGQDYLAGQTEAYIFQILVGAVQPPTLPHPQVDPTKFNQTQSANRGLDLVRSYLDTIGMPTQDVDANIQCINNLIQNSQRLDAAIQNTTRQPTAEQKLVAAKAVFNELVDLAIPCVGAVRSQFKINAPYFRVLQQAPVYFFLRYYFNIARNAPELINLVEQVNVQYIQGNTVQAAALLAQYREIILTGLQW